MEIAIWQRPRDRCGGILIGQAEGTEPVLAGLAYLGIASPAADKWPDFAANILGAAAGAPSEGGTVRVQIDNAAWRIEIEPAETDKVRFIGWTVAHEDDLDACAARLAEAGIETHVGDDDLTKARCVNRLLWFVDPWGFRHELTFGQTMLPKSFRPGRAISGFVTAGQGLGHVVLAVPSLAEAHTFFTSVLGFSLTDKVVIDDRATHFYHCSSRHHSLALAESSSFTGVHHLMLETRSINDVGTAYDICRELEAPVRKGIGRHANDQMVSFYVDSPSGLLIEYGHGGLQVNDEDWIPKTYTQNSVWGHRPPSDAPTNAPGISL